MIFQEMAMDEKGSLPGAKLCIYILNDSPEFRIHRRPLVLICPGGAYCMTSDREAERMALQFLAHGFHAAVLRYSCSPAIYPTALRELARSVCYLKEHAEEWKIIPDKIIIQGSSAGGHLAASYACFWHDADFAEGMQCRKDLMKPAGLMLSYPVITSGPFAHRESIRNLLGSRYDELCDAMSLEKRVNPSVPPVFLWHTYTDELVPVENSLLFAMALRQNGINTELHVFPKGVHGLSLAAEFTEDAAGTAVEPVCTPWIDLALAWAARI